MNVMTGRPLTIPSLEDAAAGVLYALASSGKAMIVVGRDPGPAGVCLGEFPEAVLTVPGATARFAAAGGVRIAGRTAVVVLDRWITDLRPALHTPRPNVLLTSCAAHLAAAHDAGLTVVQPGWPGDVEPLLRAALDAPVPVLVRLHHRAAEVTPPGGRARLGVHRVLRRGRAGLVVGAGAGASALVRVSAILTARGVAVTAVETHTIRPASGIDPARTGSALLVGPVTVEDARHLAEVPFGSVSPERLADAVQSAIARTVP